MRPLIGLTSSTHTHPETGLEWLGQSRDYLAAVEKQGGLPVLLPLVRTPEEAAELLRRLDGLLLTGGGDPDPHLWGEDPHPALGEVEPERDRAEVLLAREALALGMPILAICRGMQILAVAAGGRLWQDIPSQVPGAIQHRQRAPRWHPGHRIQVAPGSRLAALLGEGEHRVNSFHHQAVRDLPPGFRVAALAPDGVVEAFEATGPAFVLAVQWHPESFARRGGEFDALFRAHVEAARAYREGRGA
nr:MAG: peptidase C26 [Bacillota bacterium]